VLLIEPELNADKIRIFTKIAKVKLAALRKTPLDSI